MMMGGEIGPTGEPLPKPDILLLSYTGCFTFMKWFELIRHKYGCETVMLHVPYQGEGKIQPNMREYVVKQLKEKVIPTLERISGVKFDIDRLRQYMRESVKAEEDLVAVLQSAKHRPSPDRRLLRRGLLHRPDLHRVPRHARGHRVLPRAARRDRAAGARRQGADHARGRDGRGEVPPDRRRPAQLDQLSRVLEDVLRRGRGRRQLDVRQGRGPVRLRLPPRPRPSARVARRLLPRLLHEPEPAVSGST